MKVLVAAGAPLDELVSLLHSALCRLADDGKLSAIPHMASASDLGRWLEVLQGSGCDALYKDVTKVVNTIRRRDESSFVGGCESCGVALVVYASQPDLYSRGISQAGSVAELASALPPCRLQVDGVGRVMFRGSVLQLEIAEIKSSVSSKAWQQGCVQLQRALHTITYALKIVQPRLPSVLWKVACDEVVLVGYLCIPRSMASYSQVEECIMAFDARGEDECVKLIIQPLIL